MKVFLVKMPFFEQEYIKFSEKWEHIEDEYVGVGIVDQILKDSGVTVTVSKSNSVADMIAESQEADYDVVMVSVMQTSAKLAYRFILDLRASGYKGSIFVGGWFAKMAWKEIFAHQWPVNYVCYLDAEFTISKWIENPNSYIIGIATYENWVQQTKISRTELKKQFVWPQGYISPSRIPGRKTYSLETSRGCPHSACTFCSQSCGNYVMNKWVPLPLGIIRDEIIHLHNEYGATRFATSDDDILGPLPTARKRAEELKEMFLGLPFHASFSAAISVKAACDETIIDILQEAGLEQLCIGFESADEDQLKRYNKQQKLEDNFIAADNLVRRGVKMLPGLITFDPYSTKKTIEKNLSFLFSQLHHYDLSKLTKRLHLLTGTPIVKKCQKDGILTGDYLYYDYNFLQKDVEIIFDKLQQYTSEVKDYQKTIRQMDEQIQKNAGLIHYDAARKIINGIELNMSECKLYLEQVIGKNKGTSIM